MNVSLWQARSRAALERVLSTADLYAGIVSCSLASCGGTSGFFVTWCFILLGIFITVSGLNSLYTPACLAGAFSSAGTAKVGAILAIVLGVLVLFSHEISSLTR